MTFGEHYHCNCKIMLPTWVMIMIIWSVVLYRYERWLLECLTNNEISKEIRVVVVVLYGKSL